MSALPPRLRLSIDRLVLHGISPADAPAVRRALIEALQAQLAGVPAARISQPARLRLDVAPATDARALGRSAGRQLAAALTGGGKRQ